MSTASATYCLDDDKIRLYVGRVPRSDYDELRAAGFVATPKQDCDFVAVWTPRREDLALSFLDDDDDIEPEHYSPEERAADRAERFGEYRDKRAAEAGGHADRFEAGPQAFGHQSAARAERQAARHDRHRGRAVSQWSKAEYWRRRTEGVISSALYKALPKVRRSRILRLEAEQRKHEKSRAEYAERFAKWQAVLTMEGADSPVVEAEAPHYGINTQASTPAAIAAYVLANSGGCYGEYQHPRKDVKASLYSLMTRHEDPITAREAALLWLDGRAAPDTEDSYSARWSRHYEHRLAFEKAMLANEGGTAADADMEPGGWINTGNRTGSVFTNVAVGWKQIHAVNKSPATGRVTSVKVMGLVGVSDPKPGLVSVNIERLGEGAYRPPTDEERAAFPVEKKERKAKEKAAKPAAPPLINPTDEDAERIQAGLNAVALSAWKESHMRQYGKDYAEEFKPSTVLRITQAQYSAASKGSYARAETRGLFENGELEPRHTGMYSAKEEESKKRRGAKLCEIRTTYSDGSTYGARRVIVLTDKPQKPIPQASKPAPLPVVIVPEQPAEEKEIVFTAGNLFGGIS